MKLQKQMKLHGDSTEGMPPVQVTAGQNGEMMVNDGVTRATRVDTFNKIDGTSKTVPVEVIETNKNMNFDNLPTVGDKT